MAHTIAYVCQGCGSMSSDESSFKERGFVNKKLYCSTCVEVVDEYLKARDNFHTMLAREWSEQLAVIQGRFTAEGGIKSLPDGG